MTCRVTEWRGSSLSRTVSYFVHIYAIFLHRLYNTSMAKHLQYVTINRDAINVVIDILLSVASAYLLHYDMI